MKLWWFSLTLLLEYLVTFQLWKMLADRTAFLSDSRLIEVDETEKLFTHPAHQLTERYVRGDFG